MNLFEHIQSGCKAGRGDKIIVLTDIKNGAGMVTAKAGDHGVLLTDVLSGELVRIKINGHLYAINYAPAKSLMLETIDQLKKILG